SRTEAHAVEHVERFRTEIHFRLLAEMEALGERDVLTLIPELAELGVESRLVTEILGGAGELRAHLGREERRRLGKAIHRRIETAPRRGAAPVVIARDQRAVAAGEQHRRRSHRSPKTERLAAGVVADVAYAPVAKQVGGNTMSQIGFPLANREFVNDCRFDVVSDVELAD